MTLHRNQLDDAIINFAQKLLKKQFPSINGLQNTLLQAKKQVESQRLQVVAITGSLPPQSMVTVQTFLKLNSFENNPLYGIEIFFHFTACVKLFFAECIFYPMNFN